MEAEAICNTCDYVIIQQVTVSHYLLTITCFRKPLWSKWLIFILMYDTFNT
jgi:hypothetical protein